MVCSRHFVYEFIILRFYYVYCCSVGQCGPYTAFYQIAVINIIIFFIILLILQNCMFIVKKLSVVNVEECQLSLLQMSLITIGTLEVKIYWLVRHMHSVTQEFLMIILILLHIIANNYFLRYMTCFAISFCFKLKWSFQIFMGLFWKYAELNSLQR